MTVVVVVRVVVVIGGGGVDVGQSAAAVTVTGVLV